ncbi:MAG: threonine ammonia-lyase [Actinomycetes bacterium]
MSGLVGIDEIEAAAERLRGVAVRTPLVECPWAVEQPRSGFDRVPEVRVAVKAESLQPVGAFKIRGAYNAVALLAPARRAAGVVTHSSGNHARALAWTARELGIPAVIVMPDVAPAVKVDAVRALGAEVILVAPDARESTAAALVAARGLILVPPYDDPAVIAGQGTVGLEIAEDAPDVDLVLVPVSGGGLVSGVAVAVKARCPAVRVIGVEPALAADAQASLRTGRRVAWTADQTYRTVADGLRVTSLGRLPWEHVRALVDDIITVDEEAIAEAVRDLALRAGLVAEPSGAVALAGWISARARLPPARRVVAVLSGANVDPTWLAGVLTGSLGE